MSAITLHRKAADTAHDPLPDIARQVQQKIADAVGRLVSALPERAFRKRCYTLANFGGILLSEIVA